MFSWPPIVGRRKIVSGRVVIIRIKRFVNYIKKHQRNLNLNLSEYIYHTYISFTFVENTKNYE